jgi:drug/metabolite transporter (DMT)-like permease
MKGTRTWLVYALVTTIFWGIWGAFIEIPEKSGFPATLGYIMWSFTMIPCAVLAMIKIKCSLDHDLKSIALGSSIGLLGAGGQLLLFLALRQGPAYIIFPFISLYPVFTIILSVVFLKERTHLRQWIGIFLALVAIYFLSNPKIGPTNTNHVGWLALSILVFVMWGIQAFVMKFSNSVMKAESIFFYMTTSALFLAPVAFLMTDFSTEINWGIKGPWLAAVVQILNSIGALSLVYALRYGKAIVVVPLTGLAPMITIIISLILYSVVPHGFLLFGLIIACIAFVFLSE